MPPDAPFDSAARAAPAVAFLLYTLAVLLLAYFSHRLLKQRAFLSEYFLGSRGLGLWALAMSYAATSASAGSFTGFPALIYQHGWILALWIASYMVVPVCCMGILGKRLNQVARKTGAITVPDVLRDRHRTPGLGIAASLLMVFFLLFYLVAQFKAGAIIVEELIGDFGIYQQAAGTLEWVPRTFSVLSASPPSAGYCLALFIFAAAVTAYTVYGGFRAVVWTDVLQGVMMLVGVLVLLGFTLSKVEGGLEGATRKLASMRLAAVTVEVGSKVEVDRRATVLLPVEGRVWRFTSDRRVMVNPGKATTLDLRLLEDDPPPPGLHGRGRLVRDDRSEVPLRVLEVRHDPRQTLVTGPGFRVDRSTGFLPLALAMSFFVMWAISGAGQPTTMVRLMAFRDTKVYRRAMFSVSVYYTLVYLPLVFIFVSARSLLPGLEEPDEAMARTILHVVPGVLAGVILAAPFAAVMSTVDSFLLAISSSLVRDVYQRSLRPEASERTVRRLSYLTTLVVGIVVMLGAINPPRFLQHIIVLAGAGLACTFLAPMFFSLYWKRMTARGTYAGILGGFSTCFGLYGLGWLGLIGQSGTLEPHPAGFLPMVWGLGASILLCVVGSLLSRPPPVEIVNFYFKKSATEKI